MDTNLYWALRGTIDKRKAILSRADRTWLEAAILDTEYNKFLRDYADYRDGEQDQHGHGKRLPYIGWFWRQLSFYEGKLPIGDNGSFIGFIANNKWDYPERDLTEDEFARVMTLIDEAMCLNEQGGSLKDIRDTTHAKLDELWDYLQTLSIHSPTDAGRA